MFLMFVFGFISLLLLWLVAGLLAAVLGKLLLPRNWESHPRSAVDAGLIVLMGGMALLWFMVAYAGYCICSVYEAIEDTRPVTSIRDFFDK